MRLVHDNEDWEDDEDEADVESEVDDDTVPCPHCRRPVYEDAERCPRCGNDLSREDRPWHRPLWIIIGVAVCLGVVYRWIFFL